MACVTRIGPARPKSSQRASYIYAHPARHRASPRHRSLGVHVAATLVNPSPRRDPSSVAAHVATVHPTELHLRAKRIYSLRLLDLHHWLPGAATTADRGSQWTNGRRGLLLGCYPLEPLPRGQPVRGRVACGLFKQRYM
jgi:hypothetical protein